MLDELPVEIIQVILTFLSPGGDMPLDIFRYHSYSEFILSQNRREYRTASIWRVREEDWTGVPTNWCKEALSYASICKRFHYVMIEDNQNDTLFWSISAIEFFKRLVSLEAESVMKSAIRYEWISGGLTNAKAGTIMKEAVRLSDKDLPKSLLNACIAACSTDAEVREKAAKSVVSWRRALSDLLRHRNSVVKTLQEKENRRAHLYVISERFQKSLRRFLFPLFFSFIILMVSASFIMITVHRALYWNLVQAQKLTDAESKLEILHHVAFAPLLLVGMLGVLTPLASFLGERYLNPWVLVRPGFFVQFSKFGLMSFGGLVICIQILMIYLGSCVAPAIPWHVVLAPSIIIFALITIAATIIYIVGLVKDVLKRARHRSLLPRQKSICLDWLTFLAAAIGSFLVVLFLVLAGLYIQIDQPEFHVGYAFIPLFPVEIIISILLASDYYQSRRQLRKETKTMQAGYIFLNLLLTPSLIICHIFTIIFNSFSITAQAIPPVTIGLLGVMLLLM